MAVQNGKCGIKEGRQKVTKNGRKRSKNGIKRGVKKPKEVTNPGKRTGKQKSGKENRTIETTIIKYTVRGEDGKRANHIQKLRLSARKNRSKKRSIYSVKTNIMLPRASGNWSAFRRREPSSRPVQYDCSFAFLGNARVSTYFDCLNPAHFTRLTPSLLSPTARVQPFQRRVQ